MEAINFEHFSAGDCHTLAKPYIPKDLLTCSKVWLRVDRIKKSLESPYTGPYDVLKRYDKYFILSLPQGDTAVSCDRLKPAYLPKISTSVPSKDKVSTNDSPPLQSINIPPFPDIEPRDTYTTRSGRTVKFRQKPDYFYY